MTTTKFANSPKQQEIINVVLALVGSGVECTLRDIHRKLSYTCSKQSLLCSIEHLERHGFLIRKKGAGQFDPTIFMPTLKAYELVRREPVVFKD